MAKIKLIKGKAVKSKRNIVMGLRASMGYINLIFIIYILAKLNNYL